MKDHSILLVHGAFTDSSSWAKAAEILLGQGFPVEAVPLSLASLTDDIARVRARIESQPGPVVLAGHSYGGAVISGASSGSDKVKGLVFAAAFPLEKGESLQALTSQGDPSPAAAFLRPDEEGFLFLQAEGWARHFAPELPREEALALAACQRPIAGRAWGEPLAVDPGWKSLPSWYIVSLKDEVAPPFAQEWFAQRVGAVETVRLDAGHASPLTRPAEVAEVILKAARSLVEEGA